MTRNTSKLSTVAVGQRLGRGRGGSVRHRHRQGIQKSAQSISKPAIRRLARRAGVKRISEGIYDEAPQALKSWLKMMVHDAVVYADHAKRFTITTNDVLLALKRNGFTLYGYAFVEKRERLTKKISGSSLQQAAVRVRVMSTPDKQATPAAEEVTVAEKETTPQVAVVKKKQTTLTGTKKRKSTPQPASRRNVAPETPEDGQKDAQACVTPERAQEIQTSLSSFRDTVIARQASSDAPVPKVVDWVSAHMLGRGKAACTPEEMNIVLEALSERDALMLTDDESHSYRTVWFI
jgi:histone H4